MKNIDREHSFSPEDAYVAESWIVRKGDALFPDEPEGAWAVGVRVGDPDLWRQLKSGELTGFSLAGFALVEEEPTPSQTAKAEEAGFSKLLRAFGLAQPKEPDVTKDEIETIVKAVLAAQTKSEGDAAKDDAAKPDPAKAPAKTDAVPKEDAAAEGEKAVVKALEARLADLETRLAKSDAKGATETGGASADAQEESYL